MDGHLEGFVTVIRSAVARILTPLALIRLALGWAAVLALALTGPLLAAPVSTPLLIGALAVIIAVILIASFGVVHQAEALAHRLGDPYGSLVLTLSIVAIEVILISAVMLGPGEHATIARDSVSAVMMIICNLVIGACILIGSLKHGVLQHNRTGTGSYLGMIAVLTMLAFVLPTLLGGTGAYQPGQEIPVVIITLVIYAFFLQRQMGAQAADFHEVDPQARTTTDEQPGRPIGEILSEHRVEVLVRLGLLLLTIIPIVLMSHDLAGLLDDGLGRAGAPPALAGVLIAIIVFTPETITALRAAANREAQRVVNLCLGAFVSTVGLTIPAVLTIGLLTGQQVVLAETPAVLGLIITTVIASVITFTSKRLTPIQGALHLALFASYAVVLLTG